jgi:hypothetical protein
MSPAGINASELAALGRSEEPGLRLERGLQGDAGEVEEWSIGFRCRSGFHKGADGLIAKVEF